MMSGSTLRAAWRASSDDPAAARRLFWIVLAATLVFRLVFAIRLPITGDEAYFHFWGVWPDWGFYDHPPMVGWWLAALSRLSWEPWVLRLPALAVPVAVAAMTRSVLRPAGDARSWQAATLVLVAPLNAWNVAITTDVPLMLFAFASVAAWLRALRTGRWHDWLLTGLLLGGALMSKYFAGMLALAIAGHCLWRPTRTRVIGLVWVIVGALPAAAIQIAWNAQWCWPNQMFNFVNRHDKSQWAWKQPLLYAVTLTYVLIPVVAWRLAQFAIGRDPDAAVRQPVATRAPSGAAGARGDGADGAAVAGLPSSAVLPSARGALTWAVALPFVLFAVLTLRKVIGLHWLASFVAPAIVLFALRATPAMRRGALGFGIVFAALHYALIAGLSLLPLESFRHWKVYPGIVMTLAHEDLTRALAPWRGRFEIAADGYSPAVTLGFNLHGYVPVFGPGGSHARHDDIVTDWRRYAGRDILIVRKEPGRNGADASYFDRVVERTVVVRGATFYLTEGHGFRYEAYRDDVLESIRAHWYQVPTWLPAGPCYFCDRYFPDRACHR